MAHELDMSNDKVNIAYVGPIPWHGFGQAMTIDADAETWKREAGMDWEGKTAVVQFDNEECKETFFDQDGGHLSVYPGQKIIYRSDNFAPLSIVSSNYKIVQPGMMIDFFANLIEKEGFVMETAGCLYGGRIFWALARTGRREDIGAGDVIAPYALIVSSVDGKMATCVHLTSIRVVCWNTLRMSIGSTGKRAIVRVPHSQFFDPKLAQLKAGLVENVWEEFVTNAKILTGIKLDRSTALDIVVSTMKKKWKDEEGDEMSTEEVEDYSVAIRRIMGNYENSGIGSQLVTAKGTAWGLLNAVTQYCDYDAGYVNGDRSNAFVRTHFGDRSRFKVNIANKLLELVK